MDDENLIDPTSVNGDSSSSEHDDEDLSVAFAVERSNADYFWTEGDWDIPEEYDQIIIEGRVSSEDTNYGHLLNLLRQEDRKWKEINFDEKQCSESSLPEFLALVIACFGKVQTLSFLGHTNDLALVSCIYAGLSMKNGIKGLHLMCDENFTLDQMKMFAQGLSFAQNLEDLTLVWDRDEDDADEAFLHNEALIQGLKENNSLREVRLRSWIFPEDTLLRLIQTLQSCPSLCKVDLEIDSDAWSPVVQDTLQAWLAQEDCKLERFEMYACSTDTSPPVCIDLFNLARPNTSLKELRLNGYDIVSPPSQRILSNYKNLISLDLRYGTISDLEPFDSLLLSENCILESLMLSGNPISVDSIRSLAQKLPRMKVLRNLELSILNDDHEALRVLADAAMQNTSLERFHVISDKCNPFRFEPEEDRVVDPTLPVEAFLLSTLESDMINRLNHTLCLNRAGRRHTGCNSCNLPLHLLPIAVSRVSRSRYYKVDGEEKEDELGYYPSSSSGGLDATFWLLRQNSTFLSQTGMTATVK